MVVAKTPEALTALSEHPSYNPVSEITDMLMTDPSVGCVLMVYNYFVSTGRQVPVAETLLGGDTSARSVHVSGEAGESPSDAILEFPE